MQNEELKTVKDKIRKLLALGMSNSLNEANVAMSKAMQLMSEWALSIDDIELAESDIVHIKIDTGSKNRGELDGCLMNLAKLYSCKIWTETPYKWAKVKNNVLLNVIGYDTDVELFKHFHKVIGKVYEASFNKYKTTNEYKLLVTKYHGKVIRSQYRTGFVVKLHNMIEEFIKTNGVVKTKSGTSIVLLKSAKVDEFFQESLKIKLSKAAYSPKYRSGFANTAGSEAAGIVSFDKPIQGSNKPLMIGN